MKKKTKLNPNLILTLILVVILDTVPNPRSTVPNPKGTVPNSRRSDASNSEALP